MYIYTLSIINRLPSGHLALECRSTIQLICSCRPAETAPGNWTQQIHVQLARTSPPTLFLFKFFKKGGNDLETACVLSLVFGMYFFANQLRTNIGATTSKNYSSDNTIDKTSRYHMTEIARLNAAKVAIGDWQRIHSSSNRHKY